MIKRASIKMFNEENNKLWHRLRARLEKPEPETWSKVKEDFDLLTDTIEKFTQSHVLQFLKTKDKNTKTRNAGRPKKYLTKE